MEQYRFYQPTRIQFGTGSLDRIGEVTAAYGKKCMLVTTTNTEDVLRPLYDRVKSLLQRSGLEVVHFDKVVPNPTVQNIESAIELVNREQIEVLVAVGGGSSIDTAKTISLFYKVGQINWQQVIQTYTSPFESYDAPSDPVLPLIAVPTTAGTGSEVTQAMVISDPTQDAKDCIYHDKAFPKVSIIDPALTRTLPLCMTAITGFDAFTHAFESYLREFSSPYTMLIGLRAMALIVDALPKLMEDPQNLDLREKMSQASVFAGISLANASATLPHPLSEIIGGIAPRMAHGQCLATIYPAFLRWISAELPEKCAAVARVFDPALSAATDAQAAAQLPARMEQFLRRINLFHSFRALGLTEAHPLLNYLPFAPKETMVRILHDSYDF